MNLEPIQVAEALATLTGIVSVYLLSKGDGRGWSLGAVMITLASFVYIGKELYGSAALQTYFLATQYLGWRRWKSGEEKDLRKSSLALRPRTLLGLVIALTGIWIIVVGILSMVGGVAVWTDGFVSVGSLTAQTLMVLSYRECWIFWLVVDIVYTILSVDQGLWWFVLLYIFFCAMAVNGWREWTRDPEE